MSADSPHRLDDVHDPTVTRLITVPARGLSSQQSSIAGSARRGTPDRAAAAAVATSISVVLLHPGGASGAGGDPDARGGADAGVQDGPLTSGLQALAAWHHPQLRLEVLLVARPDDPARPQLRELLSSCGCSWRLLDAPHGGRGAMLGLAAENAEHEFVVVAEPGGASPLEEIRSALALMWSEGGDAALVGPVGGGAVGGGAVGGGVGESVDASSELVAWLGLGGAPRPGRMVILRRWVARWLFNEVTRAISPAEEVADRARLLGIGIVQLVGDDPAASASTS